MHIKASMSLDYAIKSSQNFISLSPLLQWQYEATYIDNILHNIIQRFRVNSHVIHSKYTSLLSKHRYKTMFTFQEMLNINLRKRFCYHE